MANLKIFREEIAAIGSGPLLKSSALQHKNAFCHTRHAPDTCSRPLESSIDSRYLPAPHNIGPYSGNQGVIAMGERYRSVFRASLVPALLLGGVFAVVQAQNAGPLAKPTKWSDPATWPNKKVPAAGEKVEIASGKEVILDVSPPALGGVTINGKLTFADNSDLELNTEWVM